MTRFQKENKKVRILKLVNSKSTGTPAELAEKLGISIRSAKRFIQELRDSGHIIHYCRTRGSYIAAEGEYYVKEHANFVLFWSFCFLLWD